MQEFFASIYVWLKAGHIVFVIFWMAGLFMLPRLFVYHQEAAEGSEEAARFADRERKLLKIILMPSMIAVWLLGISLVLATHAGAQGYWLYAKLAIVLGLSAYQGYLTGYAGKLAKGQRPLSGKALRLLNEVPGVAVALIVVLVVAKPF